MSRPIVRARCHTDMRALSVRIAGDPLPLLCHHFVLPYTCSNWEAVSLCASESFEGLSEGLQGAWRRGRCPWRTAGTILGGDP